MREDLDVLVHEVGPRDGLQSIQTVFSTATKLDWIKAEAAAGAPQIQVGSFVPPNLLPQMADSAEVVKAAKQIPRLTVSALVPNLRGGENGIAAGAGGAEPGHPVPHHPRRAQGGRSHGPKGGGPFRCR